MRDHCGGRYSTEHLIVSMSITLLWHCAVIWQKVTIGWNWAKSAWDFPALFLTDECEFEITSKFKKILIKNAYTFVSDWSDLYMEEREGREVGKKDGWMEGKKERRKRNVYCL